jgi:predicted transcriptional regulator
MAKKIKYIEIHLARGKFETLWRYVPFTEKEFGIADARSLLSNEKARLLHTLKKEKPVSIYALARLLGRHFKAVRKDLQQLERLGIISFSKHWKGKKMQLKPELGLSEIDIKVSL